MTKKKDKLLSCRIDNEVDQILESIMQDNEISKSETIRFLAKSYYESGRNLNPHYRNLIGWLTMHMETALNEIQSTGDVTIGRKVLEEFKCQIL